MHRTPNRRHTAALAVLAAVAAAGGCAASNPIASQTNTQGTTIVSRGGPISLGSGDAFGSMLYAGTHGNNLGGHRFANNGGGASMVLTSAPTD
jgi:hypothetical protein